MFVQANGMSLAVEDTGEVEREAVLLVAGMGMQLIGWPPPLVRGLQRAGYRVVRFDNRDIGLSTPLDHVGHPNLLWSALKQKIGLELHPPYTVQDMADDALALMDQLGLVRAHVVGISMGSMIAQRMAATAPERLTSLGLLMTSSGAPGLPGPSVQVLKAMSVMVPQPGSAQSRQQTLGFLQALSSPAFPTPPDVLSDFIDYAMQRSDRPEAALRQTLAVAADVQRYDMLARITTPTLVLHGRDDPILPWPCGYDAAQRIAGSHWHMLDGMGHDLPPAVVTWLMQHLVPFMQAHHP